MRIGRTTSRHAVRTLSGSARRGFTLAELMIVVTIFVFLAGLSFPALRALARSTRTTTGINAVTVAGAAAQVYARQTRPPLTSVIPTATDGEYSGTALLFTPRGEIRLLFNDQFIGEQGTSAYLEETAISVGVGPTIYNGLDGYKDIPDREPIRVPNSTGVFGIARGNNGGTPTLVLLSPPFAVRFGTSGQVEYEDRSDLTAGASTTPYVDTGVSETIDLNFIYVDGDYTGGVDPALTRTNCRTPNTGTNDYFPDYWDPSNDNFDADATWSTLGTSETADDREIIPFDCIETVIGVIVYDKLEFREFLQDQVAEGNLTNADIPSRYDVGDGSATANVAVDWLLDKDNTRAFLFNRHTGALFRDPEPVNPNWQNDYIDPS